MALNALGCDHEGHCNCKPPVEPPAVPEWAPSDAVQLTPFDARPATQATKDAMLNPPAVPAPAAMPEGWERARDSNGVVFHGPGDVERAYSVRWWGAHHNGLYVEGYDSAVVVPLAVIRALLATQGLRIVGEAEVPSAEERKILREMRQAKIVSGCHRGIQCCAKFGEEARANYVCQAELSRRAQQKEKP